jgi:hypothetical protein
MMKRTIAGLVGLFALAACGGGGKELSYGTAQAPTALEQSAADQAQVSLGAGRTFAPNDEPTAGGPGLADQLASQLGGEPPPTLSVASAAVVATLPAGTPAQVQRTVGRAMALPGGTTALTTFDPACITTTVSASTGSVVWRNCVVVINETDPYTLDTTDATLRVDGRLDWNGTTGVTSWNIGETMVMAMTSDGQTMTANATVNLSGVVTTAADTIKGSTTSVVNTTASYMGFSASGTVRTSMALDLGYQADPFCVTSGTLTLEQVWTRRPSGATAADLPDQGWKFEWTGCGLVTVAHGG